VSVAAKVPSGSTFAQATNVGVGCGGSSCQQSFYQLFSPASAFDLANSQWALTFNGSGYTLGPGSGTFAPAAGTTLTLSDDSGSTVNLPFALPYPGGSTNSLWVCSNGFVSAGGNSTSYDPSVGELLSGTPRWCAAWHDFNPSAGGQVRVESTPAVVRITYNAVANFSGGGTATFQYQFFPSGNVNVIYQGVGAAGNNYLAGYSRGNSSADPGSWDISANLAGGLSLCASTVPNVALASSARPVLGTTINLNTSNIPAGSVIGVAILSVTEYSPGIDLAILGMPGCRLYAGLDVLNNFATPGTTGVYSWNIPNVPAASGMVVMNQSAILKPGINAFGFVTSNAVQLLLGVQ
jgi:hypothetical protein